MNSGDADIVSGVSAGSLRLEGREAYIRTGWSGISGAWLRSAACWVSIDADRLDRQNVIPGIAGWGARGKNSKWKVAVGMPSNDGDLIARLSFGENWFDTDTPLSGLAWHRLAFIYHGGLLPNGLPNVWIYVEGQKNRQGYKGGESVESSSTQIDTETDTATA